MSALPLADIAYDNIRQKLLNGEFIPGNLLSESELASGMGMSRTPVRAAIARLEKEGFVETLLKRGILVNGVDMKELYDIFDLFSVLYANALDLIEQHQYMLDLGMMEAYLKQLIEASEQDRYRDYYENGLLFMRMLLSAVDNRCILQTFDNYKDKLLFYVVIQRTTIRSNRPYIGKRVYTEIFKSLSAGDIHAVRESLSDAKLSTREELVRMGL